jgi:hypothetical protein
VTDTDNKNGAGQSFIVETSGKIVGWALLLYSVPFRSDARCLSLENINEL